MLYAGKDVCSLILPFIRMTDIFSTITVSLLELTSVTIGNFCLIRMIPTVQVILNGLIKFSYFYLEDTLTCCLCTEQIKNRVHLA